jgi:hypothetical protein
MARKGELSKTQLDRDFPHQVAVSADRCTGKADGPAIHLFCFQANVAPRHHTVRRDDKDFIVYCFADKDHAELFRVVFQGEQFNPSERGRGSSWWQWRKA